MAVGMGQVGQPQPELGEQLSLCVVNPDERTGGGAGPSGEGDVGRGIVIRGRAHHSFADLIGKTADHPLE